MDNLDIYNRYRQVPDTAKKPISAGRLKGKTDINPMWRIKALTEQFGPCGIGWYYTPVRKWIEACGSEIAAFVDIELYIKVDGEWSKPISGTGGSMLAAKEKSGIYVSDECYKMATTDALSVACKQLGIGADVYWDTGQSKYNQQAKTEDNHALIAKKNAIQAICRKHKQSAVSICKINGIEWDTLTDAQATSMLISLKNKYGDG